MLLCDIFFISFISLLRYRSATHHPDKRLLPYSSAYRYSTGHRTLSLTRSHKIYDTSYSSNRDFTCGFICRSINILDICDLGINVSKVSSPQPLMHVPSHDRRETGHGGYPFVFGITVTVCFKHHFYIFDISLSHLIPPTSSEKSVSRKAVAFSPLYSDGFHTSPNQACTLFPK